MKCFQSYVMLTSLRAQHLNVNHLLQELPLPCCRYCVLTALAHQAISVLKFRLSPVQ